MLARSPSRGRLHTGFERESSFPLLARRAIVTDRRPHGGTSPVWRRPRTSVRGPDAKSSAPRIPGEQCRLGTALSDPLHRMAGASQALLERCQASLLPRSARTNVRVTWDESV